MAEIPSADESPRPDQRPTWESARKAELALGATQSLVGTVRP